MVQIDYLGLSKKIKSLRIEKGLKQTDVAKQLNMSSTTYMFYENNPKFFKITTLEQMSCIFNENLIEIFLSFSATKCS